MAATPSLAASAQNVPKGVALASISISMHFDDVAPSDILAAFDRFRVRAGGERFSYCPLHGAVHLVRMKKPSLDNGLVLVRYRELARLSPCKGLDDCPGVGYGVSEILSRSRG